MVEIVKRTLAGGDPRGRGRVLLPRYRVIIGAVRELHPGWLGCKCRYSFCPYHEGCFVRLEVAHEIGLVMITQGQGDWVTGNCRHRPFNRQSLCHSVT